MKKFLIIISVIFLSVFAFFFSNIKGYYRFKQYCEAEGGLRVYEPLERNVGWLAEDKYEAQIASQLNNVSFVRYTDKKDDKAYDIRYLGGHPQFDSSFQISSADNSKEVTYYWNSVSLFLNDELRLKKSGYGVIDFKTRNVLVGFYTFYYSPFNQETMIFGHSDWKGCKNDLANISNWISAINSAFKK